MKLYLDNPRKLLLSNVEIANTFYTRLMGLMFKKSIPDNYGLIISPCRSIHMFFMRFPIDVLFVDRNNTVVECVHNIKPWRISKTYFKADYAIEIPAGKIKELGIKKGDTLYIEE